MTNEIKTILDAINAEIKKDPGNAGNYKDLYALCVEMVKQDTEESKQYIGSEAQQINGTLRERVATQMQSEGADIQGLFDVYKQTLLLDAPHIFDSYMLYVEIDRRPEERFYQPRRKILKPLVDAIQDLADDKLDELFLSLPPRVGKTTLLMFLLTWLIGRDPESTNLYSAYSDTITSALYRGVLEVLNDKFTYRWADVFPTARIVGTNAADETLNINRHKRYPSLTCRSLYGTLNGACDCNGFEIWDDLIGGIEEALNPDRLNSAWTKVDNNLIPRAKESAKIISCGTRWSIADPAGKRMEVLTNSPQFKNHRWKIINIPALDENDESNFDYDYGVGFSTEFYHQRRASFERNADMASWEAQYMGEPVEREGVLFRPDDLRFFNGELPDGAPDRVYMAVDPAFGGGDYVSAPVAFAYGEDRYIVDVVYSNAEKETTQLMIADLIEKYGVGVAQFECNKSTRSYMDGVGKILSEKNVKCSLRYKPAPHNVAKEVRIFDHAGEIREYIYLDDGKRNKMYSLFMQNLYSFKLVGKNKHDDAPDSLAMLCDMTSNARQITTMRRFF